jgi:hypothetical protein
MVLAGVIGVSSASTAAPADFIIQDSDPNRFLRAPDPHAVYLWKITKMTNKVQLIVTTPAFILWIYTLGGPFAVWGIEFRSASFSAGSASDLI